jgi:hypothetical protein
MVKRARSKSGTVKLRGGSRQAIRALTVSLVGLPDGSSAGVKRALLLINLQVVESSVADPLDWVMVQLVTVPSTPTASLNPVVPCSPALTASAG